MVEKQKGLVGGGAIFNPSTWEAQKGRSLKACLVYSASCQKETKSNKKRKQKRHLDLATELLPETGRRLRVKTTASTAYSAENEKMERKWERIRSIVF